MVKETIQNTQKKQENKLDITKIMWRLPKTHSVGIGPMVKSGANPDNIVYRILFWWYGVLEAARAGMKVQGVVSFHGGLGHAARVNNVIKRVLVLHGADDLCSCS
jgi:hypothetical protein